VIDRSALLHHITCSLWEVLHLGVVGSSKNDIERSNRMLGKVALRVIIRRVAKEGDRITKEQ